MNRFSIVHNLRSAAVLGSGANYTEWKDVGELSEALIITNVTAKSGTSPTLDTVLQTSPDKGTTVFDMADSFTQITDVAKQVVKITNFGKWIRLKQTIGGSATPTLTMTVDLVGKS
jgi:hypothetical protein